MATFPHLIAAQPLSGSAVWTSFLLARALLITGRLPLPPMCLESVLPLLQNIHCASCWQSLARSFSPHRRQRFDLSSSLLCVQTHLSQVDVFWGYVQYLDLAHQRLADVRSGSDFVQVLALYRHSVGQHRDLSIVCVCVNYKMKGAWSVYTIWEAIIHVKFSFAQRSRFRYPIKSRKKGYNVIVCICKQAEESISDQPSRSIHVRLSFRPPGHMSHRSQNLIQLETWNITRRSPLCPSSTITCPICKQSIKI